MGDAIKGFQTLAERPVRAVGVNWRQHAQMLININIHVNVLLSGLWFLLMLAGFFPTVFRLVIADVRNRLIF